MFIDLVMPLTLELGRQIENRAFSKAIEGEASGGMINIIAYLRGSSDASTTNPDISFFELCDSSSANISFGKTDKIHASWPKSRTTEMM